MKIANDPLLVDVVPLIRMPSTQRGVFTYRVPESLAPRCTRGAYVRVPFRRKRLWGVVVASPSTAAPTVTMFQRPLKHGDTPFRDILNVRDDVVFTEEEVAAMERIADLHRVSLATTAYLTLPHPPGTGSVRTDGDLSHFRTKMRKVSLSPREHAPPSWVSQLLKTRGLTVAVYRSHSQRVEALCALASTLVRRQRSLLILTPHRAWLSPLADALAGTAPIVLLDRAVGRIAQWEHARAARMQPSVIIATRAGAFTAPPTLGAIVIDNAEDDDLKQYDADPRYDARTVAAAIATARGIPLLQLSVAPRVVDWAAAARRIELGPPATPPTIIDLRMHWRGGGRGFLTETLLAAITQSIERSRVAVILHNRRGRMSRLTCRDCNAIPRCERCQRPLAEHLDGVRCHHCQMPPVPLMACPTCGSSALAAVGIGTVGIVEALRQRFPNARIVRVDRDAPHPPPRDAAIIVGSERFSTSIAPMFQQPVGLLAVLHAERFTRGDDFRANERLLQALSRARAWSRTWDCPLLVQTSDPGQPTLRALDGDLSTFYRSEIEERQALRYPPFARLIRCDTSSSDAERDGIGLRRLLERNQSGTVLSIEGPYAFGLIHRKPVTSVLIRLDPKADDQTIAAITAEVPTQWSIDLDPIALHA